MVSPRIYKTSITRFLALTKAQINKTTSNYTKGVLLQNLIGFVIISCPLVLSNWIPPLLTVPRSLLSRLHSAQSSLIHSGGATLLELRLALQPKLMEGDRSLTFSWPSQFLSFLLLWVLVFATQKTVAKNLFRHSACCELASVMACIFILTGKCILFFFNCPYSCIPNLNTSKLPNA